MRFLIFLRETVFPYILFIAIIGGGLGSIAWLIASTYFWNTSQLTLLVDSDVTSAEVRISARVIYQDLQIFDVAYPVHIVFPWTQTIPCKMECILTGLPHGEAEIIFRTEGGVSGSEYILIEPDTQGKIDLRSAILVKEITDAAGAGFAAPKIDTLPTGIPSGAIVHKNVLQGLFLFWDKSRLFLYDTVGRQSIMLPTNLTVTSLVRGVREGEYYLLSGQNEIWLYDRYARNKTEKVLHSAIPTADLVWEETQTKLTIGVNEQFLPGKVFWFERDKKYYLFDGEKVFEIINN